MIISIRHIVLALLGVLLLFLTFKYLISINIGFSVRVPHLIIGTLFILETILLTTYYKIKLKFKELLVLILLFCYIAILNGSYHSLYLYYFIFIYISIYCIYLSLDFYQINPKMIAVLSVYFVIPHILLSYITLHKEWHGGLQITSYSDFNTFFAMQLAIIFPFIGLLKYKMVKSFFYLLFMITLFFLGSRGALLSIFLMYLFVFVRQKNTLLLFGFILLFLMALVGIYIIDPGIVEFYLMKINPYSHNYDNNSDMNRYYFIIGTLAYMPHWWNFFIGNSIKGNQHIIAEYMSGLKNMDFNIEIGATVHNLFLELYSDFGIVVMLFVIAMLIKYFFTFLKVSKINKMYIPFLLSLGIFIINYNLEPNYVHYFFWFYFMLYSYTFHSIKGSSFANTYK